LLRQLDQKIRFTERINALIHDPRDPRYTCHQQQDLIAQRIFAIALGYEDVNDQQTLRKDPAMLAAVKNTTDEDQPLPSNKKLKKLSAKIVFASRVVLMR
jgi:hypothetical protein